MKILGLEFSSDERSVALGETSESAVRILASTSERGRGGAGLTLVDRTLTSAGVPPAEIDLIAIGLGPGSYAGIRSAIAICQGWQLARGTPLLGISSVDVLARDAQGKGILGRVTLAIDAQRKEYYRADFEIGVDQVQLVRALGIVPAQALATEARLAGPGGEHVPAHMIELFPSAQTLIRIAALRTDYVPGEQLQPIYLRETSFVKAVPARFS